MKQPNILLIMCDQFRYDTLSYKQHPDVKTPYLDTLASEGFSFDKAYSACPSCIPARTALFTGQSQARHGRVGYEDGIAWKYPHMLPQVLREHDYQSQCVGKLHVYPTRKTCGFDNVLLHDGYLGFNRSAHIPHHEHQDVCDDYLHYLKDKVDSTADVSASGVDCNSWVCHPWMYEERLHPTNWVVDQSIRFLQTRERARPFFLMASFVRPHQPFDAPASYFDLYKDKELRTPAMGDFVDPSLHEKYGSIKDSIHGCKHAGMRRDAMAGYYASITHLDHQIGRLLLSLQEDGSYEDTIILFVSDHGEMLFDHHLYRKVFAYEGSAHIPCIFHVGSRVAQANKGCSDTIVELRDLMPTLLDFAHIPIPSSVNGRSLVDDICGCPTRAREYLHGEHSFHSSLSSHFIVTSHDKFIWYSESGIEQYFNLDKDPREEHNAIEDQEYLTRIAYLRLCLCKELEHREEGYSDGRTLQVGCTPQNTLKKTI